MFSTLVAQRGAWLSATDQASFANPKVNALVGTAEVTAANAWAADDSVISDEDGPFALEAPVKGFSVAELSSSIESLPSSTTVKTGYSLAAASWLSSSMAIVDLACAAKQEASDDIKGVLASTFLECARALGTATGDRTRVKYAYVPRRRLTDCAPLSISRYHPAQDSVLELGVTWRRFAVRQNLEAGVWGALTSGFLGLTKNVSLASPCRTPGPFLTLNPRR